jgi:Uncharacterized protein conserved in bacteria (DUF2188)
VDNYHITKKVDGWQLKKEGSDVPLITSETKAEAIASMREFMKDKIGSVKIHNEDGKFQEERTYPRSHDPEETEG